MGYAALELDPEQREQLLEAIPPAYSNSVCDHITLGMMKQEQAEQDYAYLPDSIKVVGVADDGKGIQALVTEIDGTTERRYDNKILHITHSLDPDKTVSADTDQKSNEKDKPYNPFHSNKLLQNLLDESGDLIPSTDNKGLTYTELNEPITLNAEPVYVEGDTKIRLTTPDESSRQDEQRTQEQADDLSPDEKDLLDEFYAQQDRLGTQQETQFVGELYQMLPYTYRQEYYGALWNAMKQTSGADFIKHSHGVWLEMSRLRGILEDSHETVDPGAKEVANPDKLEFQAYTGDNNAPKSKVIKIENDIPVVRDGKPFIYETKFLPARFYGTTRVSSKGKFQAQHHDQVLKYQQAIESGLVSGAAIEVQGRIDPAFLSWLYGSNMLEQSPVPGVELIYSLQLPSGAEYRTRIKRSQDTEQHLNFTNDYQAYTSEDRNVIAGLEWALRHPDKQHIINILSSAEIHNPSPELSEYLDRDNDLTPSDIQDADLYREYQQKRLETVWQQARSVQPPLYNELNEDTPLQETYADKERAEHALRQRVEQYQAYLQGNPQMAKIKKSYLLGEPGTQDYQDNVEAVTQNLLKKVSHIREQELARQEEGISAFENAFGWEGPKEGYALDIDHIMMDVIMEVNQGANQKGRSYENPEERFMSINGLVDYIAYTNPDRQQRDAYIYDPLKESGEQVSSLSNTSDKNLSKEAANIREHNIQRMRNYLKEILAKPDTERSRRESKILSGYKHNKRKITIEKAELKKLYARVKQAGRAIGEAKKNKDNDAFEAAQAERQRLELEKEQKRQELLDAHRRAVGNDASGLEKTLETQEHNIIKFIYTVDHDGNFHFDEERFDAERAGRSSHSELVGGGNVYGAGEIAMEKRNGQWILTEINNGSGHYRPHPSSLPYVYKAFESTLTQTMQQAHPEMDVEVIKGDVRSFMSEAQLVDSLARGRPIQDMDPAQALEQRVAEASENTDQPSHESTKEEDAMSTLDDSQKRQAYEAGELVEIDVEGETVYVLNANGRPAMFTYSDLGHISGAHIKHKETGSKFSLSFIEQYGEPEDELKSKLEGNLKDRLRKWLREEKGIEEDQLDAELENNLDSNLKEMLRDREEVKEEDIPNNAEEYLQDEVKKERLKHALKDMLERTAPSSDQPSEGKYELNPQYDTTIGGDALQDLESLIDKLHHYDYLDDRDHGGIKAVLNGNQENATQDAIGIINDRLHEQLGHNAIEQVDENDPRRGGCFVLNKGIADELQLEETNQAYMIAFPGNDDPDKVPPPVANAWQAIERALGDDIDPSQGVGLVTAWPGGHAPPVSDHDFWQSGRNIILDTAVTPEGPDTEPAQPSNDMKADQAEIDARRGLAALQDINATLVEMANPDSDAYKQIQQAVYDAFLDRLAEQGRIDRSQAYEIVQNSDCYDGYEDILTNAVDTALQSTGQTSVLGKTAMQAEKIIENGLAQMQAQGLINSVARSNHGMQPGLDIEVKGGYGGKLPDTVFAERQVPNDLHTTFDGHAGNINAAPVENMQNALAERDAFFACRDEHWQSDMQRAVKDGWFESHDIYSVTAALAERQLHGQMKLAVERAAEWTPEAAPPKSDGPATGPVNDDRRKPGGASRPGGMQ